MEELSNLLIENDKILAPYLLAASFNGHLHFLGSTIQNGILYWKFSPKDKAEELIHQFRSKSEPRLPAQDIFQAISTWWQEISEMKNGGHNGPR